MIGQNKKKYELAIKSARKKSNIIRQKEKTFCDFYSTRNHSLTTLLLICILSCGKPVENFQID